MIVALSGAGGPAIMPRGWHEGLKTHFESCGPADAPEADGWGDVSKHYPQPAGTRPLSELMFFSA